MSRKQTTQAQRQQRNGLLLPGESMNPSHQILIGNCLELLRGMPDNSIDSIVTDPPYGLSKEPDMAEVLRHWLAGDDYQHKGGGFMGKTWDSFVPGPAIWRECLRVLKPGGHLLAFFGSRTHDIGTLAIRLAGFEIRDMGAWLYGSGFPKSMDVSKAIDKAAGAEREVIGSKLGMPGYSLADAGRTNTVYGNLHDPAAECAITAPSTDAARQWQGWGTALKPAHEPITFARKPLIGTVAANVLAHGTGAINVDGCRVDGESTRRTNTAEMGCHGGNIASEYQTGSDAGRFPANLIHDGSDEVVALFPMTTSGGGPKPGTPRTKANTYGEPTVSESHAYGSSTGSAARFFYCAKASKRDRDDGLEGFEMRKVETMSSYSAPSEGRTADKNGGPRRNIHPTVKPTDLMAYLCRLVTPTGGTVLDPFMGSGSTGKAAIREGFSFIGCELSPEYAAIAQARIDHEAQRLKNLPPPSPQLEIFADNPGSAA